MIEDKLGHDERLRLECIAQAIQFNAPSGIRVTSQKIIDDAKKFETWIMEVNR